jgi:hypothetical protein
MSEEYEQASLQENSQTSEEEESENEDGVPTSRKPTTTRTINSKKTDFDQPSIRRCLRAAGIRKICKKNASLINELIDFQFDFLAFWAWTYLKQQGKTTITAPMLIKILEANGYENILPNQRTVSKRVRYVRTPDEFKRRLENEYPDLDIEEISNALYQIVFLDVKQFKQMLSKSKINIDDETDTDEIINSHIEDYDQDASQIQEKVLEILNNLDLVPDSYQHDMDEYQKGVELIENLVKKATINQTIWTNVIHAIHESRQIERLSPSDMAKCLKKLETQKVVKRFITDPQALKKKLAEIYNDPQNELEIQQQSNFDEYDFETAVNKYVTSNIKTPIKKRMLNLLTDLFQHIYTEEVDNETLINALSFIQK